MSKEVLRVDNNVEFGVYTTNVTLKLRKMINEVKNVINNK